MEIFVGNLAFDLTREEIAECFGECGEVVSVRMLFDASSRFRGIAYVEFADDASARAAVKALAGRELKGRAMKVDFARPARPRFNGFGAGFSKRRRFRARAEAGQKAPEDAADADARALLAKKFKPKFRREI